MTDHLLFHVKVPLHTSALGLKTVDMAHEKTVIAAIELFSNVNLEFVRADHHEPVAPVVKVRAPRRTPAQIDADARVLADKLAAE